VLCGSAILLGVVIAVVWPSSTDPRQRVLTSTTTGPTTSTTHPTPAGLARSRPLELRVPSLGISTTVAELGLQANNEVQVPASVHTVGWFRLGPTPGQIGSSVILGHVDSFRGPGIFFEIKSLPPGALIEVNLADGVTAQFRVTSVVQYAKTGFPDALVYGSRSGRELNLVTCGGTFDHQTGSYESNIVVFSRLVGTIATPS
jgi:hypothetical protein